MSFFYKKKIHTDRRESGILSKYFFIFHFKKKIKIYCQSQQKNNKADLKFFSKRVFF